MFLNSYSKIKKGTLLFNILLSYLKKAIVLTSRVKRNACLCWFRHDWSIPWQFAFLSCSHFFDTSKWLMRLSFARVDKMSNVELALNKYRKKREKLSELFIWMSTTFLIRFLKYLKTKTTSLFTCKSCFSFGLLKKFFNMVSICLCTD